MDLPRSHRPVRQGRRHVSLPDGQRPQPLGPGGARAIRAPMAEAGFGRWPSDTVAAARARARRAGRDGAPGRRLRDRPGAARPSRRSRRPSCSRPPTSASPSSSCRHASTSATSSRSSPSCPCWPSSIGGTWWRRVVLSVSAFVGLHAVLSTPFWATRTSRTSSSARTFRSYPGPPAQHRPDRRRLPVPALAGAAGDAARPEARWPRRLVDWSSTALDAPDPAWPSPRTDRGDPRAPRPPRARPPWER